MTSVVDVILWTYKELRYLKKIAGRYPVEFNVNEVQRYTYLTHLLIYKCFSVLLTPNFGTIVKWQVL